MMSSSTPTASSLNDLIDLPSLPSIQTLIINNYDSFTYNLHHLIATLVHIEPLTIFNNSMTYHDFLTYCHVHSVRCIFISPGPGHPEKQQDFGICTQLLQDKNINIPIMG
jgi:para-aminobenzoate synthetase